MIAVAGTGYWGKNLVRNFNSLNALHTVCDADPDTLQAFMKQYQGVNGTASFVDVLNDPEIKGIAISTPAETHANLAREAILAGKDVYVEKPLCLSEKEGAELNELARANGRILMVGHLLWYHPVVLKLKELVNSGKLGRLQYIYSNRLNLGKLRREENVLWSFAPHDISVILGLVNEMPVSIRAQGGNFLHQQIAVDRIRLGHLDLTAQRVARAAGGIDRGKAAGSQDQRQQQQGSAVKQRRSQFCRGQRSLSLARPRSAPFAQRPPSARSFQPLCGPYPLAR